MTPIMRAAKGGHYETCMMLLDMGSEMSVRCVVKDLKSDKGGRYGIEI